MTSPDGLPLERAQASPNGTHEVRRIGSVFPFVRDRLGFLSDCAEKYGDVVRLELGRTTFLLNSPEDIKHVLVTNVSNYEKTARIVGNRGRSFFGNGLVTAPYSKHLEERKVLQPMFHREIVEQFSVCIADAVDAMLRRWHDQETIDVHAEMLAVTQRIILKALFSLEPEATLDRFARAIKVRRAYQEALLSSHSLAAMRLPNVESLRNSRADREMQAIVEEAVNRRRNSTPACTDLLGMLAGLRREDGSPLSDEQIFDETRTIALGGYETLAEALTWTWYLLSSSNDVRSRLHEEADAATVTGELAAADIPQLRYCRMVLAEAMRLFPPAWLLVRFAQRSDTLPSGALIKAGSQIYISQWVMHRSRKYFSEPDRFDPERFSDEAIRARPRFTYIPFGGGRRLCIGEQLVWTEGILVIAAIARRFALELDPPMVVKPEANVTLRPRSGMKMRLRLR